MKNKPKINSAIESNHALLEIIDGGEGKCVCINSYRVCGNKPWGGGSLLYSFSVPMSEIKKALEPLAKSCTFEILNRVDEVWDTGCGHKIRLAGHNFNFCPNYGCKGTG